MPKVSSPGSFAPTVLQVIPELDAGGAERTCVDVAAALAPTIVDGDVVGRIRLVQQPGQELGAAPDLGPG